MVSALTSSYTQCSRLSSSMTCGAASRYLAGTRSCHTPGGSMMWSSALNNFNMWILLRDANGRSRPPRPSVDGLEHLRSSRATAHVVEQGVALGGRVPEL